MSRLAAVVLAVVLALPAFAYEPDSKRPPRRDAVRLAVPAFSGDDIAINVATILNLQIFRTLQVPQGVPPTSGEIVSHSSLGQSSARAVATETGSQLVLWGEAFRFAEGTIVQAYLLVANRARNDPAFQNWAIEIPLDEVTHRFEVPLPSREYDFAPVVLPNAVVDRYGSIESVKVCRDKACTSTVGSIGKRDFRALEHDANSIQIEYVDLKTGPKRGYVQLQQLESVRTEVVDFTSALIRVMRRDWPGAVQYFDKVLERKQTPLDIRVDTYLLRAMANAHMKKPWKQDHSGAAEINPYLQKTARYALMLHVSDVATAISGGANADEKVTLLRSQLSANRSSFEAEDPLIRAIDAFTAAYVARAPRPAADQTLSSDLVRRTESTHR